MNTCTKVSYLSRGTALAAMQTLYIYKRNKRGKTGKMNVYFCHHCKGFHFGHRPKGEAGKSKRFSAN